VCAVNNCFQLPPLAESTYPPALARDAKHILRQYPQVCGPMLFGCGGCVLRAFSLLKTFAQNL
jgi:hypothetical protein